MNNMVYTVAALLFIIISAGLMYLYLTYKEKESKNVKDFFSIRLNKKFGILTLVTLLVAIAVFLYSFYYVKIVFLKAFMNAAVAIWLIVLGYIDWKEGIIPNQMILAGIVFWVMLSLLDIFVAQTIWQKVLFFSLVGGGFCGGVLLIVAIITKSALGMGDVKMFFVIGLLYGLSNTYAILFFSVFVMAIISIVLLIAKKVTRKTAVPMAPFVSFGFLVNVLMGM